MFAQQVRFFTEYGPHPAIERIPGIWLAALVLVIPFHAGIMAAPRSINQQREPGT